LLAAGELLPVLVGLLCCGATADPLELPPTDGAWLDEGLGDGVGLSDVGDDDGAGTEDA
jgi:hypothetical protein